MFKLLSSVIFATALFSDIASSESYSRMLQSWYNMDLPMVGDLITPVTPVSSHYHTIRVSGRLRGTNSFNVDLVSGNDWNNDDVPLHVRIEPANQRLVTSKSVWTSANDKVWGPDIYTYMDLAANADFQIEIIIKHTHFVISVNGGVIQRRLHALPVSSISFVHVFCHDENYVILNSVTREYPLNSQLQMFKQY